MGWFREEENKADISDPLASQERSKAKLSETQTKPPARAIKGTHTHNQNVKSLMACIRHVFLIDLQSHTLLDASLDALIFGQSTL